MALVLRQVHLNVPTTLCYEVMLRPFGDRQLEQWLRGLGREVVHRWLGVSPRVWHPHRGLDVDRGHVLLFRAPGSYLKVIASLTIRLTFPAPSLLDPSKSAKQYLHVPYILIFLIVPFHRFTWVKGIRSRGSLQVPSTQTISVLAN